eukprot:1235441-Rhodomonas_salina.2
MRCHTCHRKRRPRAHVRRPKSDVGPRAQVKCLVSGKLPPDLSHTIVFTNQGLRRLRERIDELKDEKEELKRNHKQLKREHVQ